MYDWWNKPWEVLIWEVISDDKTIGSWKAEAKSASPIAHHSFVQYGHTKQQTLDEITRRVEEYRKEENEKNRWFVEQQEAKAKAERYII